jgi:hypothetical protein
MIEEGYYSPYIEHWHPDEQPTPPFLALRLHDGATGCAGQIVRVGNLFAYARGRAAGLPGLPDLRTCIAAAGSAAAAQDMTDCEISFGTVFASGWIIERSTLPFREGQRLFPEAALVTDRIAVLDRDATGRESVRRWAVTFVEGELTWG